MRNRSLRRKYGRTHIHIEHGIDVGEGQVGKRANPRDTGIVQQYIESAEQGSRCADRVLHCSGIGAVGLDGKSTSPFLFDGPDGENAGFGKNRALRQRALQ